MFVPFDLTIPFVGIYDNEITTERGVHIFNFKNAYDSVAYHIKNGNFPNMLNIIMS